MAHEFESGFVVGTQAWHGLATVLQAPPSIEDGLKLAGLDWRVISCRSSIAPSRTRRRSGSSNRWWTTERWSWTRPVRCGTDSACGSWRVTGTRSKSARIG
jgi:hypothetical protein